MRRLVLGFAILIVGLAFAGNDAPANTTGGTPYCQEDAPCWNWRTMGDHKRGVVLLSGRHLVVGPVRYDRLNSALRIDWSRTPKLKGDGHRYDVQNF